MIKLQYKNGIDKTYQNVKSMAKGAHSLASTLDLVTLNGTESGPLELSKRQYRQILAEVQQAIFNLELAESNLKKYLK